MYWIHTTIICPCTYHNICQYEETYCIKTDVKHLSLWRFCVRWTGIRRGAVKNPLGHFELALRCGKQPNTTYKLSRFYCKKLFCHSTYNYLRSTPPQPCHVSRSWFHYVLSLVLVGHPVFNYCWSSLLYNMPKDWSLFWNNRYITWPTG